MGVTPLDWSRKRRAQKNPGFGCRQKTGIGAARLARPFSDLFNVAASRPAKYPRGRINAPGKGRRQARQRPRSAGRDGEEKGEDSERPEHGADRVQLFHLTMRARVSASAAARSVAIRILLVGMMASRVHGQ